MSYLLKIKPEWFSGFKQYIPESLWDDVLYRPGDMTAIGAVNGDGLGAGALTAFMRGDGSVILRSLYVDASCRRQGLGSLLLAGLEKHAAETGARVISARYALPSGELNDADRLFSGRRFTVTREGIRAECTTGRLREGGFYRNIRLRRRLPLFRICELKEHELMRIQRCCEKELPEFLRPFTQGDALDAECSFVCFDEYGVYGLCLVTFEGSYIELASAAVLAPGVLNDLVYSVITAAAEKYGADMPVVCSAVNDKSEQAVRTVTDGCIKTILTAHRARLEL